jgi:hypothetical protein
MRFSIAYILLVIPILSVASPYIDRLLPGERIQNNQQIISPNGKYKLVMQTDGSLVLYRSVDGSVRYRMEKYGSYAIMQSDGNFVEYNSNNAPLWASNTGGKCDSCWVQMMDNGDLQVKWENTSGSYGYVAWAIGPDLDYPPIDAVEYPMVNDTPAGLAPPLPTPAHPPLP